MSFNTVTGLLLLVVPVVFNVTFFMLARSFDYPDILRQPTEKILQRFKAGGAPLRRLWYVFALGAILFTPVPVLVQQVFGAQAPWYLAAGTTLGVVAGVVQFLGLLRWPFLVNTLADLYTAPDDTPPPRIAWPWSFKPSTATPASRWVSIWVTCSRAVGPYCCALPSSRPSACRRCWVGWA